MDIFWKVIPFLISLTSIVISLFAMRKSNAKANYLEQDKQYADLLKLALRDPELRDYKMIAEKLKAGDKKFLTKYNVYAYLIWNCMETFYDLSSSHNMFSKKQVVDSTWLPVILEENKIHYKWFKQNQRLFKQEFRDYINQLNDVNIRVGDIGDLDAIYDLLIALFPANEVKSKEKLADLLGRKKYVLYIIENTLLTGKERIIGFTLAYVIADYKSIWIDYFAISPSYQDIGYGTLLFNNVTSSIGDGNMNVFTELEIPPTDNPASAENSRIRFYERQGVKRLDVDYKLPIGKTATPMYLYFKPANTSTHLTGEIVAKVVSEAMEHIHDNEPNMPAVRDKFVESIQNTIIHY